MSVPYVKGQPAPGSNWFLQEIGGKKLTRNQEKRVLTEGLFKKDGADVDASTVLEWVEEKEKVKPKKEKNVAMDVAPRRSVKAKKTSRSSLSRTMKRQHATVAKLANSMRRSLKGNSMRRGTLKKAYEEHQSFLRRLKKAEDKARRSVKSVKKVKGRSPLKAYLTQRASRRRANNIARRMGLAAAKFRKDIPQKNYFNDEAQWEAAQAEEERRLAAEEKLEKRKSPLRVEVAEDLDEDEFEAAQAIIDAEIQREEDARIRKAARILKESGYNMNNLRNERELVLPSPPSSPSRTYNNSNLANLAKRMKLVAF